MKIIPEVKKIKKEDVKMTSFKIRVSIANEFAKLARQKGIFQGAIIENAMLLAIEELKKMKDKK